MNTQQVNSLMDDLKNAAGDALVGSSIISFAFGQSIAVYNTNPKSDALLSRMTKFMSDSMAESRFGSIGKYYTLLLGNNHVVHVLVFKEYCWGMMINTKKLPLGMIMNVITPDLYEGFEKVLSED